jgi:3-oxoacyl-[acyl-carrier protein] reductase
MFANRIALVSGGSRGIGFATALLLAREGGKVALLARNREAIDAAVAAVNNVSANSCVGICCDVADETQRRQAFEEMKHSVGEPTLLLNAAGISRDSLLARQSDSLLQTLFRVNVEASSALSKLVLRSMIRNGGG